jgi:DNA-binding transcriptional MerR regulator
MDKAPDAYRTISEVGEDLDLPQHVLRFWETRFGQIKPLKRGGGRRYYRPDDVELLKGIRHLLYKEGYTIKGVQRILKEQGVKAVQAFVRESLSGEALQPYSAQQSPPRPEPSQHEPFMQNPAPAPRVFVESNPPVYPSVQVPTGFSEAAPIRDDDASLPDFEPALHRTDVDDAAPAPAVFEPAVVREPAPAGQVSMFRGGLQRGEGTAQPAPMAEFANQIRERVEHPHPRAEAPAMGARDALLIALEELISCRATIDRILAGRQV